ncbi:hypothetical protein E2C01_093402 [Portunus trituberculatus]|uniref:Uncharacterized protein n=1 Tax=Portunus trituberculatus TaxID=210409 RepID=A0A5B7JPQ2_PORTR|nr:hypothetical protein [Portunus trituberculatus]
MGRGTGGDWGGMADGRGLRGCEAEGRRGGSVGVSVPFWRTLPEAPLPYGPAQRPAPSIPPRPEPRTHAHRSTSMPASPAGLTPTTVPGGATQLSISRSRARGKWFEPLKLSNATSILTTFHCHVAVTTSGGGSGMGVVTWRGAAPAPVGVDSCPSPPRPVPSSPSLLDNTRHSKQHTTQR